MNVVCGVIIKYNPCSHYARLETPCKYYSNRRTCNNILGECNFDFYDMWYKKVLQGQINSFYPNRIKLLELENAPLFVYHSHKNAIVGEAEVTKHYFDGQGHFYEFPFFIEYQHPVSLEILFEDSRLPKMSKINRWRSINITKNIIDKIRLLSGLPSKERKKLNIKLNKIISNIESSPQKNNKKTWMKELVELSKEYKEHINSDDIIKSTIDYAYRAKNKTKFKKHSIKDLFFASLYLSYRIKRIPIRLKDISKTGSVKPKKISQIYSLLKKELKIKVSPIKPETHLVYYTTNYPRDIVNEAIKLSKKISANKTLQGRNPSSIAAYSLFRVCEMNGNHIKKNEIAKLFGITTLTITNLYEELE